MTEILTPTSPGEILDKLTILQIKSERITDAEKVANVRVELAALQNVVATHIPQSLVMATLTADLKTVNEDLWTIEDEIRDCERDKDFGLEFVALARSVYVTSEPPRVYRRVKLSKDEPYDTEKAHPDLHARIPRSRHPAFRREPEQLCQ